MCQRVILKLKKGLDKLRIIFISFIIFQFQFSLFQRTENKIYVHVQVIEYHVIFLRYRRNNNVCFVADKFIIAIILFLKRACQSELLLFVFLERIFVKQISARFFFGIEQDKIDTDRSSIHRSARKTDFVVLKQLV